MPGARVAAGDRVTLRTVEPEDAAFLQRASATPDLRYPMGRPVKRRTAVEDGIEDGDGDRLLVCIEDEGGPGTPDADDLRRIGLVTVRDVDWKRPDLGYWLVPAVHGEGYGAEAVSLAIDYVFRSYDVPAIEAEAFAGNDASRGLLESLGFTQEGRLRKYTFADGEYRDLVTYSVLREEWDG